MLFAVTQRSVALVLFPLLAIGLFVYLLVNIRRARPELGNEIELAPNRKPYFDDEELEGPRLDRFLTMALVLLAVTAVGLPLYWLAEPGRQTGAIVANERTFARRGEQLFEANCVSCHASGAGGGVADYILNNKDGSYQANVSWKAPALNNALLRFSRAEVQYVLDHGRAPTPMQPWSVVGGGAMNAQQIKNLIDYLQSVTLSTDEARDQIDKGLTDRIKEERAAEIRLDNRLDTADEVGALLEADAGEVDDAFATADSQVAAIAQLYDLSESEAKVKLGELLFNNEAAAGSYSCARCHTAGWSYSQPQAPGGGALGPRLVGVDAKFRDEADFADFLTKGCNVGQAYGAIAPDGSFAQCKSGMMPAFGETYTQEQIAAVVAYVSAIEAGDEPYDFDPAS
jgi:mono/diheme cytochrome c family protein